MKFSSISSFRQKCYSRRKYNFVTHFAVRYYLPQITGSETQEVVIFQIGTIRVDIVNFKLERLLFFKSVLHYDLRRENGIMIVLNNFRSMVLYPLRTTEILNISDTHGI